MNSETESVVRINTAVRAFSLSLSRAQQQQSWCETIGKPKQKESPKD